MANELCAFGIIVGSGENEQLHSCILGMGHRGNHTLTAKQCSKCENEEPHVPGDPKCFAHHPPAAGPITQPKSPAAPTQTRPPQEMYDRAYAVARKYFSTDMDNRNLAMTLTAFAIQECARAAALEETPCRFCGKPKSDELHQADEDLLKHSSFTKDDYHNFTSAPPLIPQEPFICYPCLGSDTPGVQDGNHERCEGNGCDCQNPRHKVAAPEREPAPRPCIACGTPEGNKNIPICPCTRNAQHKYEPDYAAASSPVARPQTDAYTEADFRTVRQEAHDQVYAEPAARPQEVQQTVQPARGRDENTASIPLALETSTPTTTDKSVEYSAECIPLEDAIYRAAAKVKGMNSIQEIATTIKAELNAAVLSLSGKTGIVEPAARTEQPTPDFLWMLDKNGWKHPENDLCAQEGCTAAPVAVPRQNIQRLVNLLNDYQIEARNVDKTLVKDCTEILEVLPDALRQSTRPNEDTSKKAAVVEPRRTNESKLSVVEFYMKNRPTILMGWSVNCDKAIVRMMEEYLKYELTNILEAADSQRKGQ